jgi:hypothetical protein
MNDCSLDPMIHHNSRSGAVRSGELSDAQHARKDPGRT